MNRLLFLLFFLILTFFSILVTFLATTQSNQQSETQTPLRSKERKGNILPTSLPWKYSPFIIDAIIEKKISKFTIYENHKSGEKIGQTCFRFYTPGPTLLVTEFNVNIHDYTPRITLFNDLNQPISSGSLINIQSSGLYKIQIDFKYASISEINLMFDAIIEDSYVKHLNESLKTIEFDLGSKDLNNLNLYRRQMYSHLKNVVSAQRGLSYPKIKNRINCKIKTPNGNWAIASVGLAGRNHAHITDSELPSIDVEINAGELVLGLKKFKLYNLSSKGHGVDFVLESLLKDNGHYLPRQDIVKIILNGKKIGYMLLLEKIDTAFFEHARTIEGQVVKYDTDSICAVPNKSRFKVQGLYRNKQYPVLNYPHVTDNKFCKKLNKLQMAQSLAFAMTYSCNHGLNQTDFMFYLNSRKNQYYPIIKDMNYNVEAIDRDTDFKTPLKILSSLLPNWRPNTPSHASYFVLRDKNEIFDFPFFWWSVCPQTLNWFSHEENFTEFINSLMRFSGSNFLKKLRVRHNLFRTSCSEQGIKSFKRQNFPIITQKTVNFEKLSKIYTATNDNKYSFLKSYISRLTKNKFTPTNSSLNLLDWRNTTLKSFPNKETTIHQSNHSKIFKILNLKEGHIKGGNIFTFLYRNESENASDIIFLQRNINDENVKLQIVDENEKSYAPEHVVEFGSDSVDIDFFKILTNSFSEHEKIKLHYFSIPKKENYQYLKASSGAGGFYLGPYEISISPIDRSSSNDIKLLGLESLSKESVDAPVIIGKDEIWNIDEHTKIFMNEGSYIEVYGSLNIEDNASLTLTTRDNSWGGIHFHDTNDLNISNLFVEKVGSGDSHIVSHNGFKYTGAVTFYNTSVNLKDVAIKNSAIEDALHFVNSSVTLSNVSISGSRGDAIDADFCNLQIKSLEIKNSDGDGLDISNSLAYIKDSFISSCADKGLSIGENSKATVSNLTVDACNIGIAVKDMSSLEYKNIQLKDCFEDISSYIKKPFYGPPSYKEISYLKLK